MCVYSTRSRRSHRRGLEGALTTWGRSALQAACALLSVEWQHLLALAQTTMMQWSTSHCRRTHSGAAGGMLVEQLWVRLLSYRNQTALARGAVPGPQESMAKLIITQQGQRSAITALDMLGTLGSLSATMLGDQWSPIVHAWYWSPAFRIAGGTDEILRNILAERVLGLPAESAGRSESGLSTN